MNKVILIGRLAKDPEIRFLPGNGTAAVSFPLAVTRKFAKEGQQKADFITIKIFGKMAEATANYKKKGEQIAINGRLQINQSEKDGQRIYYTEVVAQEVEFIGQGKVSNEKVDSVNQTVSQDIEPVDDGDIPF